MSLVADYSSSSESDDTTDESVPRATEPTEKPKLPSANLLLGGSAAGKAGEVFSNPYKQAEQAKIALLERHVKMVNSDEHLKEKNGKKICWNYRKGRCRFGSNCSFAHDSDLYDTAVGNDNHNDAQLGGMKHDNIPVAATISKVQQGIHLIKHSSVDSINSLNETITVISSKKRNRPGLSESIVPSKRVLKAYSHQKQHNSAHSQSKLT